jgi:hypothetical protein
MTDKIGHNWLELPATALIPSDGTLHNSLWTVNYYFGIYTSLAEIEIDLYELNVEVP